MIIEKEIEAAELSTTKKDFYQIWNELMDTASKLSERWDPSSTNESDPGIVLLKVLTAIADKLNYNIDKNILEAFMPSATQEESMRKLCNMLGYDMKYYRSASGEVTISMADAYASSDKTIFNAFADNSVIIPIFTAIKNSDNDIAYVTTEQATLNATNLSVTVPVLEGSLVACENDNEDIINMSHLDDNNRYYLPETQIAENGIFITNVNDTDGVNASDFSVWKRVDNLNTQAEGTYCYKVGYDSKECLPYIQFPDDIGTLIEDGLYIYYIRTSGVNGNTSAKSLCVMEKPEAWSNYSSSDDSTNPYDDLDVDEDFVISNESATTGGSNTESLTDAYNSYKKTIGTFDTLVTCRDYMNKIYQLLESDDVTPLVSNIIVSDIRDDINKMYTLCTFDEFGIKYEDTPINSGNTSAISHFDLVLYPFKTVKGYNTAAEYQNSFSYTTENINEITTDLKDYKTISHRFVNPDSTDIVCIKNYLKLKAGITTTTKVNAAEQQIILATIYTALYKNFNMRKIDFGEELPRDSILEVIENADTRIKNVALEEIKYFTRIELANGTEINMDGTTYGGDAGDHKNIDKVNYLILRNILAGKVELFNYDEDFATSYTEKPDSNTRYYPATTNDKAIKSIAGVFIPATTDNKTAPQSLTDNEVIEFRAPNFKTTKTFSSYINYFVRLNVSSTGGGAIPATFETLKTFMASTWAAAEGGDGTKDHWDEFAAGGEDKVPFERISLDSKDTASSLITKYNAIWRKTTSGDSYTYTRLKTTDTLNVSDTICYINLSSTTFGQWVVYIKNTYKDATKTATTEKVMRNGLYRSLGTDMSRAIGKYVDNCYIKYQLQNTWYPSSDPLSAIYVQILHENDSDTWTKDGLGRDATYSGIAGNEDYQLKTKEEAADAGFANACDEFLLINYTPSATDSDGNSTTSTPVTICYGPGTIIRPNFELINSSSAKTSSVSWTKKIETVDLAAATYNPTSYRSTLESDVKDATKVGGMFTLGTDEQIELREKVEISFDDEISTAAAMYVYWKRANETKNDDGYYAFEWEEETDSTGKTYKAYTLQENEYFFYTDSNKTSMAWYGNGTKIICHGNLTLKKSAEDDDALSTETLLSQGIKAVPWVTVHFTETNYISVVEYQYVTLIDGYTLDACDDLIQSADYDDATGAWSSGWGELSSPESVKYSVGDVQSTLPRISIPDITWQARAKLDLNVGATTAQVLHANDQIKITYEDDAIDTIQGSTAGISVKSNYTVQSAASPYNTIWAISDDESNVKVVIDDFRLKSYIANEIVSESGIALPLDNYDDNLTKVVFNKNTQSATERLVTTLYTNIPESEYGLMMIYYIDTANTTSIADLPYIECQNKEAGKATPYIFNHYNDDGDKTWWTADELIKGDTIRAKDENRYLRPGINIIYLTSDIASVKIYADTNKKGAVVFSDLRLVKCTPDAPYGINLTNLGYKTYNSDTLNTTAEIEESLLAALNTYDVNHNFYYCCVPDNSTKLSINKLLTGDDLETVISPKCWYDYNNSNNKFVISEISLPDMKTGITISSSSKK